MSEIMENVPSYKGISYERLDASWGRQWALDGASSKLAAISGGAEKAKDKEYPFHLIAGRINYHQQTGTMAAKFGVLAREYPTTYAELNEEDAERLGLERNRPIRISSRTGSLVRTLAVSDSVPPGCVYVPHFFGGDSPNVLASYECDPISGVPAYKACAVKVEAAR